MASTLESLGTAHLQLDDNVSAKDVFERALPICEKHYGQDHYDVANTLTNLGGAYNGLGDCSKAEDLCERALKIHLKHHGQDHFEMAAP